MAETSRPNALEIADAVWTRPTPHLAVNGHQRVETGLNIAGADVARWVGTRPPLLKHVVAELIPDEETTVFGADGGAGKSMLAQTAATCIAGDRPFLGRAVDPGAAVYITAEDRDGVLHLRQERINRELDLSMEMLRGRLFIRAIPDRDVFLFANGRPTRLADELEAELATIANLRLVVVDSAALTYDDNEIDRRLVGRFVRDLSRRALRLRCAMLLLLHTSKSSEDSPSKAFSGSTAWVWQARAALLLKPETKGEAPSLTVLKTNLGKPGLKIDLTWTDNHVLKATVSDDAVDRIGRRALEREIFKRVDEAWAKDSPLSSTASTKERFLPGVMARAGHKAAAVEAAMLALLDSGALVKDQRTTRTPRGLRVGKAPDWYREDVK